MPISENDTLFNLIGTTYGGDGIETFALPNLQSRVPIHMGTGPSLSAHVISETAGQESVTLTVQQTPAHTHPPQVSSSNGTSNNPAGKVWANWTGAQYSTQAPTPGAIMNASAMAPNGGSQPHENMLPYLTINFIISLFGIYPPRT